MLYRYANQYTVFIKNTLGYIYHYTTARSILFVKKVILFHMDTFNWEKAHKDFNNITKDFYFK